ncbi:FecR domain-containing protein [Bordetella genomosp. 12]|uniref:FecR domain-containing protein n=1 Tax=Bordetella genomosp. 12 TaxID=463035 RepID=UPI000B9EEB1F|nr:FecR domain-containing protein [Bordetella genomosp. 12]
MNSAVIPKTVLDQGLQWLVLMWSGEASEHEQAALRQWRGAHPDHERAWQRLQHMDSRLLDMTPAPAVRALAASGRQQARRKALRLMGLGLAAGAGLGAAGLAWREIPVYTAAYRSATGQRRDITLEDGTRITLNSDSAIDVDFDARARRVILRRGEIYIETGHAPSAAGRPFLVRTNQGDVRALGTRYSVWQQPQHVSVNVFEGAVEILPEDGQALRLQAGEGTVFNARGAERPQAAQPAAWVQGLLVAERMRLDDFLAQVGRYRPGFLRCEPQVADLIVSGVYPLADTDRILAALQTALPLRISRLTRYWVSVGPAQLQNSDPQP